MKTEIKITVRAYPVEIRDERNGEILRDTLVLDKAMLQAGAMVGLGDEDIIFRTYNRKGYRVLEIGKPVKADLSVDLLELYWDQTLPEPESLADIERSLGIPENERIFTPRQDIERKGEVS